MTDEMHSVPDSENQHVVTDMVGPIRGLPVEKAARGPAQPLGPVFVPNFDQVFAVKWTVSWSQQASQVSTWEFFNTQERDRRPFQRGVWAK